ncbi:bifunctional phosphopantothenoylcysteine decarboxylase/phosphopantothenate synthase [Mesobaculum littorinae]|uniref:Coenzyme A biosynthesis bifunctional protein CoaBC n=1 Tax=Mesobaculum littorinae TaxID=2486419 RepID=A0A438ADL6_9RHOB|nr:phosphopantothenoylcysteine decarboxylase [Mesobaculum littorinae]RVV96732.1 bifunctional phosphopantothenoylcysteine decarboxylase/phosphopantothenate synthase [Mesobaculum littorinae]
MLADTRILLIIGGGIAAYKSLDLIRRLRERGAQVTPVLTRAGAQFVTPLSVSALAGQKVYTDLWDLTDEAEMGHIQLSRVADLIVVAPATADLMAKMAGGHADDLASTLLLATDTRVLVAPAMNVRMWDHPATRRNRDTLAGDGILSVGPDEGHMACGEYGPGRMAEPLAIVDAVMAALGDASGAASQGAVAMSGVPDAGGKLSQPAARADGPLAGRHAIVTSGPTHEPLDPVRYIANRSSGAQGAAVAAALVALGARVSFVTGPAAVPPPEGVEAIRVETARQMQAAVQAALPADIAVFAAAVADWRMRETPRGKIKKTSGGVPALDMVENPDILSEIAHLRDGRPALVVGFAAETEDVVAQATAKRARKGCDWILANDVSEGTGIMGGADNAVTLITEAGPETWDRMAKDEVGRRLAARIAEALS